jgi:hypothetical protein
MKTTGITFKDIIKEIYQDSTMSVDVNQNSISSDKYDDLDNFNNFYKQKQKEFNDILETLNLADYSNLLKQSGQYRFNSKDKDFVKEILSEYTKKLEPLRRADYNNADPDFIIKLHDGFITLFQNLEVSDEQLNEIGNSLSNRIKYLRKLMESKTRLIEAKTNDLIRLSFAGQNYDFHNLDIKDMYAWLSAMVQDFDLFYSKWKTIIEIMAQLKDDEISEQCSSAVNNLSKSGLYKLQMENIISAKATEMLRDNEEYQEIIKQINAIIYSPKKQPLISKVRKEFDKLQERKDEILKPLYNKISQELFNCDYEPLDLNLITLDSLTKENALLDKAIYEYVYELKMQDKWHHRPTISDEKDKEIQQEVDQEFIRIEKR